MPSADDLENENFDFEIEMVYLTTKNKEEIYEILIDISEVDEVIVDNVSVNTKEKEAQNDIKDEVKPKEKEEEFEETVKNKKLKSQKVKNNKLKVPNLKSVEKYINL